jgi:hypothetical protein
MLGCLCLQAALAHDVKLEVAPSRVDLGIGAQTWRFSQVDDGWTLESIEVSGKAVAKPLSRSESFFAGGGVAHGFVVLTNDAQAKSIRFLLGTNSVTYTVDARERLPLMRVRVEGPPATTCVFRMAAADPDEHGAWVTRGYVATDADGHEDFIDSSGPMVFGHSAAADLDVMYVFLPVVKEHIQGNGRSEQRSDT